MAGWALNPETPPSGGTGIDGIDVWAFPQAGGSAVFVGAAPYGVDRQDVATQYGPQFRYSGYRLTTSHLWAGEYTLAAYPHYAGTARYGAPAVSPIHLAAGPMVWVDQPAGSTTIGQPFTVSGWALDRRVSAGTGIDQVLVYARRLSDGTYVYLGAAQSGQPRPDVGSALGSTFVNSGYRLDVTTALPPDFYQFGIYARSANPAPGAFPYFETWTGIVEVQ